MLCRKNPREARKQTHILQQLNNWFQECVHGVPIDKDGIINLLGFLVSPHTEQTHAFSFFEF